MNYLFIVQGEGRGHMIQSLALAEMLERHGHHVEKVFLGVSRQREVPGFYKTFFGTRLQYFSSPNFIRTADRRGIRVCVSIVYNLVISPVYIREIFILARNIRRSRSVMVVNFYDMVGGLAWYFSFCRKKMVVPSHHFFFGRPEFSWPARGLGMRFLLILHSALAAPGKAVKVALSFTPADEDRVSRIVLAPPLLRSQVLKTKALSGDFILVYLLNEGFLDDISHLASREAGMNWHIFTGSTDHAIKSLPNVILSAPAGEEFIREMAGCRVLLSTAGFEAACEAAYLGKPMMVFPSGGHFEQECNALDTERAGLGIRWDLKSGVFEIPDRDETALNHFRLWCEKADDFFINLLKP